MDGRRRPKWATQAPKLSAQVPNSKLVDLVCSVDKSVVNESKTKKREQFTYIASGTRCSVIAGLISIIYLVFLEILCQQSKRKVHVVYKTTMSMTIMGSKNVFSMIFADFDYCLSSVAECSRLF